MLMPHQELSRLSSAIHRLAARDQAWCSAIPTPPPDDRCRLRRFPDRRQHTASAELPSPSPCLTQSITNPHHAAAAPAFTDFDGPRDFVFGAADAFSGVAGTLLVCWVAASKVLDKMLVYGCQHILSTCLHDTTIHHLFEHEVHFLRNMMSSSHCHEKLTQRLLSAARDGFRLSVGNSRIRDALLPFLPNCGALQTAVFFLSVAVR